MGRQKRNGSQLASQIAAETGEEELLTVPAENVTAVGSDGSETPLTELRPDLKGEDVQVEKETVLPAPESPVMYTAEQVQQMMQEAAAKAVAEALKNIPQQAAPQIVQVSTSAEQVHFLWMAPVADDNVVQFGDGGMYGNIVGKTGSFYVPKPDLSRILTEMNRRFMAQRWLLVVSGLTDEEREALGVDYKPGEVLDKRAFAKLVELGDELLNIYPALCEGHKVMAAQMYADAYRQGSRYVTRERTVKLNALSKRKGHEKGDFIAIIEDMNEKDTK
jgi:hypothetical protein